MDGIISQNPTEYQINRFDDRDLLLRDGFAPLFALCGGMLLPLLLRERKRRGLEGVERELGLAGILTRNHFFCGDNGVHGGDVVLVWPRQKRHFLVYFNDFRNGRFIPAGNQKQCSYSEDSFHDSKNTIFACQNPEILLNLGLSNSLQ